MTERDWHRLEITKRIIVRQQKRFERNFAAAERRYFCVEGRLEQAERRMDRMERYADRIQTRLARHIPNLESSILRRGATGPPDRPDPCPAGAADQRPHCARASLKKWLDLYSSTGRSSRSSTVRPTRAKSSSDSSAFRRLM